MLPMERVDKWKSAAEERGYYEYNSAVRFQFFGSNPHLNRKFTLTRRMPTDLRRKVAALAQMEGRSDFPLSPSPLQQPTRLLPTHEPTRRPSFWPQHAPLGSLPASAVISPETAPPSPANRSRPAAGVQAKCKKSNSNARFTTFATLAIAATGRRQTVCRLISEKPAKSFVLKVAMSATWLARAMDTISRSKI